MKDFWYKLIESSTHLGLEKLSFPFLIGAYRLKTGDTQFSLPDLLVAIQATSIPKDNGKSAYISLCSQSEEFKIQIRNTYGTATVSPFTNTDNGEPIYYDRSGEVLGYDLNLAVLKLVNRCNPFIDKKDYSFDIDSNK